MDSLQPAVAPAPLSPSLVHGRLTQTHVPGFGIHAINLPGDDAGSRVARWLLLDGNGHVVASAHSELLAIAKMQILLLAELTSQSGFSTGETGHIADTV
jgi:hypothetical protein